MNTYYTSHKTLRSSSSSIHGGIDSILGIVPKLDTDQRTTHCLCTLREEKNNRFKRALTVCQNDVFEAKQLNVSLLQSI